MDKFELNNDQQLAADAIFEFLLNPNDKYFVLEGKAGCGKTTLVNHLLTTTIPAYKQAAKIVQQPTIYGSDVYLTATTNKAASLLKIKDHEAMTIYTLMNLILKVNYTTGKEYITKNKKLNDRNLTHSIIFIDEASMIGNELWRYINEAVTNFDCKVIFVGDSHQLKHVGSSFNIFSFLKDSPKALLTQSMRNGGNPVLDLINLQYFTSVGTNNFWDIRIVKDTVDHLKTSKDLESYLNNNFVHNKFGENQILCFTNKRLEIYANKIRELRNLPSDRFVKGETVILNSPYKIGKQIIPTETVLTIVDSHEGTELILQVDTLTSSLTETTVKVIRYHCKLLETNQTIIVSVPHPSELAKIDTILDKLVKDKLWFNYYNIKELFGNLRLAEVSTIHKSQGSSYNNVLIDLDDIGSNCWDANTLARLMYVAVSRTRKNIHFFGSLPNRFGEIHYETN